jgi:hypothetical protein
MWISTWFLVHVDFHMVSSPCGFPCVSMTTWSYTCCTPFSIYYKLCKCYTQNHVDFHVYQTDRQTNGQKSGQTDKQTNRLMIETHRFPLLLQPHLSTSDCPRVTCLSLCVQPTVQSSTGYGGSSLRAVDGDPNTRYVRQSKDSFACSFISAFLSTEQWQLHSHKH